MHKTLSVLSLVGFIVSSIKADAPYQPAVNQPSQVDIDTPQTSYAPAAAYPNSDTISLNNQAYDPTLFSTFVSQDAVQKYASQYGDGYMHVMDGLAFPIMNPAPKPTFVSTLQSFVPGSKMLLSVISRIVALVASAVGIVFFGGAVTSFVCAFTPFCTLTLVGLPLALLRKESKEIVDKIASEVTPERLKRASDILKLAVDKYQQFQNE